MTTPEQILKKYWGYPAFRSMQPEIIQAVLEGNDVLALLPTGGGKSICFQVPALVKGGICLVVSPLIALMRDQVNQLTKRGVSAAAIYSGMQKREIDIVLDNCVYGKISFLYLSPERLRTEIFRVRVQKMPVALIAVDEAHCISQWGFDFRPSYLQISELRELIPGIPMIALTASAPGKVQQDIIEQAALQEPKIFRKSFARKNLSYSVFKLAEKEKKMLEILQNVPGSSIIYVTTRRQTVEVARTLNRKQVSATFYHGGLDGETRQKRQEAWINGDIRVVVATNAFGMGIDKPDVRTVIHLSVPDSVEAYYQEAGRGGRDEKTAFAVLLYDDSDIEQLKQRIIQSTPSVDFLKRVYQAIANHLKIAVGSHSMESFDIDISVMIRAYDLPPAETYYALKKLQEEGLVQLTETVFQKSRVHFLLEGTELYKFQVANEVLDPYIKALLRLYGGELFSGFLSVNESDIAKLLSKTVEEVRSKLAHLASLEIIIYDVPGDKQRITFLTPRQETGKLSVDHQRLEERNRIVCNKMEAMVKYVENTTRCRTQQIQEYFDEVSYVLCNMCDYCLAVKKSGERKQDLARIKELILQQAHAKELSIFKLQEIAGGEDQVVFSRAIRELLDQDRISMHLDTIRFK